MSADDNNEMTINIKGNEMANPASTLMKFLLFCDSKIGRLVMILNGFPICLNTLTNIPSKTSNMKLNEDHLFLLQPVRSMVCAIIKTGIAIKFRIFKMSLEYME